MRNQPHKRTHDYNFLAELWKQGLSAKAICEKAGNGLTTNVLAQIMNRRRDLFPLRPRGYWRKYDYTVMSKMWKDGYSATEIAAKIGGDVTPNTIYIIATHNRDLFPSRFNEAYVNNMRKHDYAKLSNLWKSGLTVKQIVKKYKNGLSETSLISIMSCNRDLFPYSTEVKNPSFDIKELSRLWNEGLLVEDILAQAGHSISYDYFVNLTVKNRDLFPYRKQDRK